MLGLIIGASGLGLGAYSTMQIQTGAVKGEEGDDGDDGTDGQDGPGEIIVGIMGPDQGEIISGNITIRAMIAGSDNYAVNLYINGSLNATYVPFVWNSSKVADGWWNITIIVIDIATNNQNQDEVVVYVQNVEDLTNVYYCSSHSEIEDALDTIGSGNGIITITENITLSSQININGGGTYIIQGAGLVTLDRNANDETFYITNVQSLTLKYLIIDTSDITSSSISGIYVNEGNDNHVCIENVQIGGGGNGQGIYIESENVRIENCIINNLYKGIYLGSGSAKCYILDNSIFNIVEYSGYAYCIHLYYSDFNIISGNLLNNTDPDTTNVYSIYVYYSDSNIISDNVISDFGPNTNLKGIYLYYSGSNTISGNLLNNFNSGSSTNCIQLHYSDSNIIKDNVIKNIGGVFAWGFYISNSHSNTISYNVLIDFVATTQNVGIYLTSSNNNAIIGNIHDSGISEVSCTGNEIWYNVLV